MRPTNKKASGIWSFRGPKELDAKVSSARANSCTSLGRGRSPGRSLRFVLGSFQSREPNRMFFGRLESQSRAGSQVLAKTRSIIAKAAETNYFRLGLPLTNLHLPRFCLWLIWETISKFKGNPTFWDFPTLNFAKHPY